MITYWEIYAYDDEMAYPMEPFAVVNSELDATKEANELKKLFDHVDVVKVTNELVLELN